MALGVDKIFSKPFENWVSSVVHLIVDDLGIQERICNVIIGIFSVTKWKHCIDVQFICPYSIIRIPLYNPNWERVTFPSLFFNANITVSLDTNFLLVHHNFILYLSFFFFFLPITSLTYIKKFLFVPVKI